MGTMPSSLKRLEISGDFTASFTALESLSTIAAGVPGGAKNITQLEDSMAGPPDSLMVGTSGALGKR